jgi:putative membrane protein
MRSGNRNANLVIAARTGLVRRQREAAHAEKRIIVNEPSKTVAEKASESAGQLAKSAKKIERSTERVEDSADRRTELSADRTVFAAERTYAAWVRTGLFAMASGIGANQLLAHILPTWLIIVTETVMMVFSAFCFGAAAWRYLNAGAPPPTPDAPALPRILLIAFTVFLALVALAVLVGLLGRDFVQGA